MKFRTRALALVLIMVLLLPCFCLTVSARGKLFCGVGFVTTTKLRLYRAPSSKSEVLDTAFTGDCVILLQTKQSRKDGWYPVIFNLQEGYMLADCLAIQEECHAELGHGRINGSEVSLRSGPGTNYTVLDFGKKNDVFYILGVSGSWYQVLKDNATCYVRSDLMDLTEIPYENRASENEPQFFRRGEAFAELTYSETEPEIAALSVGSGFAGPVTGAALLTQSQKCIGVPYVYGGYSPSGFDCSGLVYYVLTQMGYPAARTAAAQYDMGYYVDRSELLPGDLVFFSENGGSISHVGIYAGGNQFLHAPNTGSVVSYGSLSGYWSDHYHCARRIG